MPVKPCKEYNKAILIVFLVAYLYPSQILEHEKTFPLENILHINMLPAKQKISSSKQLIVGL